MKTIISAFFVLTFLAACESDSLPMEEGLMGTQMLVEPGAAENS